MSIEPHAREMCLIVSSRLDPGVIDTAMAYKSSEEQIKVRSLGDVFDKVASLQSFVKIASGALCGIPVCPSGAVLSGPTYCSS